MTALVAPTGRASGPAYRIGTAGPAPLLAADHVVEVPLDHHDPRRGTIEVSARELRRVEDADTDRPYLVFLQGGPGGKSPRPADTPGWWDWALERYRVLLLDQRGTGRSTPVNRQSLAALPDAKAQAEHLALFRADSIVADCEVLRRELLGDEPWTTLGQSYGGFCTFTYASFAPQGLRECLVTGGIPPLGVHPDDVYRTTFERVAERVAALDEAYPHVRVELARIARHVDAVEERLPTGERLTGRRVAELGHGLGMQPGPDTLLALVEEAWVGDRLSDTFLAGVASDLSYATNPLYAVLHESIYCGPGVVSAWSADRVRAERGVAAAADLADGEPLPLTGEMVFRDTVAADPALAPLAEAADLLAERVWDRPLYDLQALSRNTVPIACTVYEQDMYVDAGLSRAAAALVPGTVLVSDPDRHHDGLRRHGPEVLDRLEAALR